MKENLHNQSTQEILERYGGLIEGHVSFRTHEHGNGYVEKMNFLKHPEAMNELAERIARLFMDKKDQIDIVVGPVHMGVVLAYAVAFHLDKPYTLTYKEMRTGEGITTGSTHFHRSASPEKGDRILFVDDFVSTGNDMRRNLNFFSSQEMETVGVGLIGMRRIDTSDIQTEIRPLVYIDFWKTPQDECSLCEQEVPFIAINIRE